MLRWFSEKSAPAKPAPVVNRAAAAARTAVPSKEEMDLPAFLPSQGIVVEELSMEEFLRIYKHC